MGRPRWCKSSALFYSGICCSGLICTICYALVQSRLSAPRDADTAKRYANPSGSSPEGKKEKHHARWCKSSALFYSGICCSGGVCAICSGRCYSSLSAPRDADTAKRYANPPGSSPEGKKEKTPRKVVFLLFLVHLQGFEPGTH